MKLVIDIPAEDFEKVKCGRGAVSMMRKAIIHGTPLPDGAEILTKEAYSDLCRKAANVPNFESEEYIEQRLEGYDKLLKSGVLDCVKYSSTPNGDSSTDSTTVEPERKPGHWIIHSDDLFPSESTQECSECHEHQPLNWRHSDNYCPNCGAPMEVVNEPGEEREE